MLKMYQRTVIPLREYMQIFSKAQNLHDQILAYTTSPIF